jgi:hypothetical protein
MICGLGKGLEVGLESTTKLQSGFSSEPLGELSYGDTHTGPRFQEIFVVVASISESRSHCPYDWL